MYSIQSFLQYLKLENTDILAIDGPCGSGKSTLAKQISELYDVDVIHMDDFFLPLHLRTPERFLEPGGNVHYERFLDEVINGILSKEAFSYQRFNCKLMDYDEVIHITNNKPIVIEGSYSLRPDLRSIYTKKAYLTVDSLTQQQRLIQRVGLEHFKDFQERWIPKEEDYFHHFHIEECADFIINSATL